MRNGTRPQITLGLFTLAFVSFALAISWAIFSAIAEPEVSYARTYKLVAVSCVFATIAIACLLLDGERPRLRGAWLLAWTAALLAYLLHFYWGLIIMFDANWAAVFARQGWLVAFSNIVLTVLWPVQVSIAWPYEIRGRVVPSWALWFSRVIIALVFISFILSTLVFGTGSVSIPGGVMLIIVVSLLGWRTLAKLGLVRTKPVQLSSTPE